MNSSRNTIDVYLDAIATYSNAASVNLCLYPINNTEKAFAVYKNTQAKLPEFESNSSLEELIRPFHSQHSGSSNFFVVNGKIACSKLIFLNISNLHSLYQAKNPLCIKEKRIDTLAVNNEQSEPVWLCLGLIFKQSPPNWLQENDNLHVPFMNHAPLLSKLLYLGSYLIEEAEKNKRFLSDPITSLSGRVDFQNRLGELLSSANVVALILINPMDFQQINKKFGHDAGDSVIGEIATKLVSSVRKSDLLSRFGGALFAVGAKIKLTSELQPLLEKLQKSLSKSKYLNGTLSPDFNFGISIFNRNDNVELVSDPVNDLIGKADQALFAAKQEKTTHFVVWQEDQLEKFSYHPDHIGNIFTADTATDYRNMLLLWDISNLIATNNDFYSLLENFIVRLAKTFNFHFAGLFKLETPNKLSIDCCYAIDADENISTISSPKSDYTKYIKKLVTSNKAFTPILTALDNDEMLFIVPFNDNELIFTLVGKKNVFSIASDSQLLLIALVKQLGRAHVRATLEKKLNLQLLSQQDKLKAELSELKQSINASELHYQSEVMQKLMNKVQRTAKSNTTTLIIGESGTGKERLAHTIHQLGSRFDKPFVIVDCGSIPESLIESELFGYIKGAFTGAQNANKGRILEADGGTLMLDEIGELPIQVQAKLLRFVQEKQFTPVGGTQTISVNVKIVAVTNRDLEDEVKLGNFRQDLFYRLNVVVLRPPPLRHRIDDILLLAKHFLKRYSIQHEEPLKTLAEDAIQSMLSYHWPGNVRELENKLMQASLLCEDNLITCKDLNIKSLNNDQSSQIVNIYQQEKINDERSISTIHSSPTKMSHPYSSPKPYAALSTSLNEKNILTSFKAGVNELLTFSRENNVLNRAFIGQWLEDDLVMETFKVCKGNSKQVALRLGLANSTVRRRLKKLELIQQERPREWGLVLDTLIPLIQGDIYIGKDSIKQLKLILMNEVLIQYGDNPTIASTIMGMSEPTFYKWKKQIATKSS
ncbi:sigma 54-interacting transcriptional regulator [Aliikangiella sp. IMCC44632]